MNDSIFVVDRYLTLTPGEPIRLLPIGKLVKNGNARELTKEFLAKFKLPGWFPAIKLGSHEDETPAGGHITDLEVREDGLWGIPELNDEGRKALEEGRYRYFSPEILWSGYIENSETGDKIEGPVLMGLALLHNPHLAQRASLYHVEAIDEGVIQMAETNQDMVSVGALERLKEFFAPAQPPAPEPQEVQTPEPVEVQTFAAEYQEAQAQVDQLTAQIAEMQQAQARNERIATYSADLGNYAGEELVGILADMPEEQADVVMQAFRALAAQADAITEEVGASGTQTPGTVQERVNAAIDAYMADHKVDRQTAAAAVAKEQPELLKE